MADEFNERDSIRLDYTDTDGEKRVRYRGMMPGDDEQKAADQLVQFTIGSPDYRGVKITRVARVLMGDGGPWNDQTVREISVVVP